MGRILEALLGGADLLVLVNVASNRLTETFSWHQQQPCRRLNWVQRLRLSIALAWPTWQSLALGSYLIVFKLLTLDYCKRRGDAGERIVSAHLRRTCSTYRRRNFTAGGLNSLISLVIWGETTSLIFVVMIRTCNVWDIICVVTSYQQFETGSMCDCHLSV